MAKKICILGAGKSYIYSLGEFIASSKHQFEVYLIPADFGGSSGLWNRLLEFNDSELNNKLHSKTIPNLTWGDINKTIIYFLNRKSGKYVSSSLDFRSNDLAELINEFDILADFLALEQDLERRFYKYLVTCYDFFIKNQKDLKFSSLKPLCLGYIWQTFLYWESDCDIVKLNDFYKNLGILPQNIVFQFTSENRQNLIAKDQNKKDLFGEDEIDLHLEPVLPETLKIENLDKSQNIFKPDFITSLKNSDMVIIPHGSVTNWIPFVNYKEVEDILVTKSKEKKLFWIVNPFFVANEYPISKYLDYLKNKEILPILLAPKNLDSDLKNTNNVDNLDTENLEVDKSLEMSSDQKYYLQTSLSLAFEKLISAVV